MKHTGAVIGTFDGVHKGHCAVLDKLTELCSERNFEPVAITFNRHPLALIDPQRTPATLTPLNKKIRLLSEKGVKPKVFEFEEDLRSLTAEQWLKKIHDELGVRLLVIGYDNTFGCDGLNLSMADYKELGSKLGIEVFMAPEIEGVSSSAIRKAIKEGKVENAREMLGRRHRLSGTVVTGNQIGRSLGFPTANISPEAGFAIPAYGVYSAEAVLPDGETYPAMVNIGTRPTLRRGNEMVIEAHLIGYSGDLYGKRITLRFNRKIRDEQQFETIQALKHQLEQDLHLASDLK